MAEIKNTVGVYVTDYGTFDIAKVLSNMEKSGVEDDIIDLMKHLLARAEAEDTRLPDDTWGRFNRLAQDVAENLDDVGALVVGAVVGDSIYVHVGGDLNHRATVINSLSKAHRIEYHRSQLEQLEKEG